MLPMSKLGLTALVGCLLFFITYPFFQMQRPVIDDRPQEPAAPDTAHHIPQTKVAKIAKVSAVYGEKNPYYAGAIQSHQRHADRHGYPVHILRNPVTDGYWNKAQYLLSLLVQELAKPADERLEWLMWFDADSVIINPEIPLEIFLPPDDSDDIHFLVSKDQNGLNTGIFFVRVHPWSVKMFTKTLGYPIFTDTDLGHSADQMAMALIFNETEYQPHIVYQPRIWYNTYQFHHGYEGTPGHLLVHFPGLEDDRWNQMQAWLDNLDDKEEAMRWSIPVQETHYPKEISVFWDALRSGYQLLETAERKLDQNIGDLALSSAIEGLKFTLNFETDQALLMQRAIERTVKSLKG